MKSALCLFCLCLLLGACQPRTLTGGAVDMGSLWVAQSFSGGRQCEPGEEEAAPDSRSLLEADGIQVFDVRKVPEAVCMACGICPAYAETHFLRIDKQDRAAARALGYRPADPPPEE